MAVIQDLTELRGTVRALMPDQTVSVLPDARLDIQIALGMSRLNKDSPAIKVSLLPKEDSNGIYDLNSVVGWVDGFSEIRAVWVAYRSQYFSVSQVDYRTWDDPVDSHLKLAFEGPFLSTGESIQYSSPWMVKNLEGAASTTLPRKFDNALTFICTAIACFSLATGAAGTKNSNIAGSLVAHAEESRRYREVGRTFENLYAEELGLAATKGPAAGGVFVPSRRGLQSGLPFVTHR